MSWHGFWRGETLHVGYVDERKSMSKKKKKLQKKVKDATSEVETANDGHWPVSMAIAVECDELKSMLIDKNRAYGNSALEPVRIFSTASAVEQLLVRIDDKISRLVNGSSAGEDVELDLLGYLILLRIARKLDAEKSGE